MAKDVVLKAGDKAPAFTLQDQSGTPVKLSAYKGRKVLIFFYPKADTPGCTAQACGLRDIAGDVGDTVILGISPDLPAKQQKFDTKYTLGFPLLSDADHAVAEAYGVWGEKKNYGKVYMGIVRSAFLVDEAGKLSGVWYKVSPKDTPTNLLNALPSEHMTAMALLRPIDVLPHRPPFLFVDEVTELVAGRSAKGHWKLTGDEAFFAGHFPGRPTLPGVLMCESIAELGVHAVLTDERFAGKLPLFGGLDSARFRRQAGPGDTLELEVTLGRMSSRAGKGSGRALVGGELACECELLFVLVNG